MPTTCPGSVPLMAHSLMNIGANVVYYVEVWIEWPSHFQSILYNRYQRDAMVLQDHPLLVSS